MSNSPDELLTPWIGTAYRHINANRDYDVLDFSHSGLYKNNRWNMPGEPTLYLAGDIGVAIAEWGRHFPISFSASAMQPLARDIFKLHLRLTSVLDLRTSESLLLLTHGNTPDVFRDVERA